MICDYRQLSFIGALNQSLFFDLHCAAIEMRREFCLRKEFLANTSLTAHSPAIGYWSAIQRSRAPQHSALYVRKPRAAMGPAKRSMTKRFASFGLLAESAGGLPAHHRFISDIFVMFLFFLQHFRRRSVNSVAPEKGGQSIATIPTLV
jgi:hypothetical protein